METAPHSTINVHMAFLSGTQRELLRAVSQLGYCNPFLTERVELERAVLGAEFVEGEPVWSYRVEQPGPRENVWRILRRLEPLAEQLRDRLREGLLTREPDLVLYEDAVLHLLYTRYYRKFYDAGFGPDAAEHILVRQSVALLAGGIRREAEPRIDIAAPVQHALKLACAPHA